MISRLMAADLVSRTPREDDPRIWALELTETGKAGLVKVRAQLNRINSRIESVLTPSEVVALADALKRLADIEW